MPFQCKNVNDLRAPKDNEYLSKMQGIWNMYKHGEPFASLLKTFFNNPNEMDSYMKCLFLMYNASDYKSSKANSLCGSVLTIFMEWQKETGDRTVLTRKNQDLALEVAIGLRNVQIQAKMAEAFKLASCASSHVPIFKEMLSCNMYKEVGYWVIILKIGDAFTVNELIVPLYGQDRIQLIDDLLDTNPSFVVPFLQFLDSMLSPTANPKQICESILLEINADLSNFMYKKCTMPNVIIKYTRRILDKHPDVNSLQFKNFHCLNVRKRMKFLVYAGNKDTGMSKETIHGMLEGLMDGQDDAMKEELIYKLITVNDLKSAVYWAGTLTGELSPDLRTLIDKIRLEISNEEVENEKEPKVWDSWDQYFHTLSIPESSVIFVDTETEFEAAMQQVCQSKFVGIDCEWSPLDFQTKLSLIQLSIQNQVFVLDAIALYPYMDLWNSLAYNIIENPAVIKLGFSLKGDLKVLSEYLGFEVQGSVIFDLMILRHLIASGNLSVPFPYAQAEDEHRNSLTQLVYDCFGKHLKKTQQFSDWNVRPLTKYQLHYAALDAYVLVEIFNKLVEICSSDDALFESIIPLVAEQFQNSGKKKKKKSSGPNSAKVQVVTQNESRQTFSVVAESSSFPALGTKKSQGLKTDSPGNSCSKPQIVQSTEVSSTSKSVALQYSNAEAFTYVQVVTQNESRQTYASAIAESSSFPALKMEQPSELKTDTPGNSCSKPQYAQSTEVSSASESVELQYSNSEAVSQYCPTIASEEGTEKNSYAVAASSSFIPGGFEEDNDDDSDYYCDI